MGPVFRHSPLEMPPERVEILVMGAFGGEERRWLQAIPALRPKQWDYRSSA